MNQKYLEKCSVTKTRQSFDKGNEDIINRINPSTLKPFKNNPYTHGLDSHVFN